MRDLDVVIGKKHSLGGNLKRRHPIMKIKGRVGVEELRLRKRDVIKAKKKPAQEQIHDVTVTFDFHRYLRAQLLLRLE